MQPSWLGCIFEAQPWPVEPFLPDTLPNLLVSEKILIEFAEKSVK